MLGPLFLCAVLCAAGESNPSTVQEEAESASQALAKAFAEAGLRVDAEAGLVGLSARVLVRDDLLEYVLVGRQGATHESLFLTEVQPSLLNAALLTLGVEPGRNARWIPLSDEIGAPEPGDRNPAVDTGHSEPGRAQRRPEYRVESPEGGGFYLYVGWRTAEEIYFFRVDDLVSNVATGRSLTRHRWVFLGSRFASPAPDQPEMFLADLEGNLINLSFFHQGNTIVTAADPSCVAQTIWTANRWLLPQRESEVLFVLSRERRSALPADWVEALPEVSPPPPPSRKEPDGR